MFYNVLICQPSNTLFKLPTKQISAYENVHKINGIRVGGMCYVVRGHSYMCDLCKRHKTCVVQLIPFTPNYYVFLQRCAHIKAILEIQTAHILTAPAIDRRELFKTYRYLCLNIAW